MSWFNFGKKEEKAQPVKGAGAQKSEKTAAPKQVQPQAKVVEKTDVPAAIAQSKTTEDSQLTQKAGITTEGLVVEEGLNSVADTAAMFFANGQYDSAQSTLTQHLNETRGDTDRIIWYLLLDLYQIQKNKPQFEKLAELFAKKFGVSPPSWQEMKNQETTYFSGRNVIVLEGALDINIQDKVKDFIKTARAQKTCKIECSRVDVEQSTIDGLNLWVNMMKSVRQYKLQAVLMGEVGTIEYLKNLMSDENKNQVQPYWLLLLELYQWRGQEQEFEDLAFDFAVKFELSPPGFDIEGVMKSDAFEDVLAEKAKQMPIPPTVLTEGVMNDWLEKLSLWLCENPTQNAEIDLKSVERLSFEAAGSFSAWAHKDLNRAKRVRLVQPNNWVLVVMNMVNLLNVIKAVAKKSV
jgi:hypothetical protein